MTKAVMDYNIVVDIVMNIVMDIVMDIAMYIVIKIVTHDTQCVRKNMIIFAFLSKFSIGTT